MDYGFILEKNTPPNVLILSFYNNLTADRGIYVK